MKTSSVFSKWFKIVSTAVMSVVVCASAAAQSRTNQLRIGVYDSRAVAIAFANSKEFQEALKPVLADYQKAKDEKNDQRMKEIEARMRLQQRRLHEQGFSTGSVAGTMAKVKDELPALAKKAGVQMIVSKWELNYCSPDVETVDVTEPVAALFHPNENVTANRKLKVSEVIKSLKNQPPLPIEDITDDLD